MQAKGHCCLLDTLLLTCCVHMGVVLLKYVHNRMMMKQGNDVIFQDVILVVNGIHSATANMDSTRNAELKHA